MVQKSQPTALGCIVHPVKDKVNYQPQLVSERRISEPSTVSLLRGGFKHFLCSSLFGEMIQFDEYFSSGLKPPTNIIRFLDFLLPLQEAEPITPATDGEGEPTFSCLCSRGDFRGKVWRKQGLPAWKTQTFHL